MADLVKVGLPRRLRKSLGKKDWHVAVNGEATLEWVLRRLADECHPSFRELVDGAARSSSWLEAIVLNGRTVVLPDDLQLRVRGGDQLYFFEVIAGG